MPEMAHACKDHYQTMLVGGTDDLSIAHGASGLDDGADARLRRNIHRIPEGKKGV
jgi:hypothetical protein